jgi:Uma2 family endonuclease
MTNTLEVLEKLSHDPEMADLALPLLSRFHDSIMRRDAFWESVSADQKAEFIQGQGIFHSPVLARHSYANRELCFSLGLHLRENPIGNYFFEKSMVRFDSNDYEPDIIFYLNEKLEQIKSNTLIHPIPDFIVEILSESTERNDRGIKMLDYASHGVGEYWVVDPDRKTVEQYLLGSRNIYAPGQVLRENGFISSELIAGWGLEIGALWQD